MLAGVASFSFMDAGLKLLSRHYPPMQVAALRGLSALPLVFPWAMYAGGPKQLVNVRWPLHLVRGVLSVFMMVTFVFGIQQLSLAKTYALFFVAPLLIAIFSVVHAGRTRQSRAVGRDRHRIRRGALRVARQNIGLGWAAPLAILGTALCYALSSILGEDHRAHGHHAVDGVLDDLHARDRRDGLTCAAAGWQAHSQRALPAHRRRRGHRRRRAMGHHQGVQARAGRQRGAARILGHGLGDPDRPVRLVGGARVADAGGRRRDHRQRPVPAAIRERGAEMGTFLIRCNRFLLGIARWRTFSRKTHGRVSGLFGNTSRAWRSRSSPNSCCRRWIRSASSAAVSRCRTPSRCSPST